jgi:pSer/pThr/pTyr-binding forkhead associated (FHA) protein
MSSLHFMVEYDEKGAVLRDLASRNGTAVNGRSIAPAAAVYLANGDLIVAGETRFLVKIILAKPEPVMEEPAAEPVPLTQQQKLISLLRRDFQPLYALLDAAAEPSVLKALFESKEQYLSLFEGPKGAQLAHFAPYLIRLPAESPFIATLVEQGWGKNWGVYVTCGERLDRLRHHFRHLLMVKLPDNKQVYFRFYDPRVLRLFLPTCNTQQIPLLFGPIRYYIMEDEKPDIVLRFSNKEKGVGRRKFTLALAAEPTTRSA